MPVKEVRGLFQALTEGGCGGLIGPTGIHIILDKSLLLNSLLHLNKIQESRQTTLYKIRFDVSTHAS